jgi:hypothetical protein
VENWCGFFSGGDWLMVLALLLDSSLLIGRDAPDELWKDLRYSGGMTPASVGSENKTGDRCYDFLKFSPESSAKKLAFWLKTKLNYAKV